MSTPSEAGRPTRTSTEDGYRAKYRGLYYAYLEVGGFRYWTLGAPLKTTTIITRAAVELG